MATRWPASLVGLRTVAMKKPILKRYDMNKREFFDSISDWKMKNMTLEYVESTELKEMLAKNVELLSSKDVRAMLTQLLYENITGAYYVQILDNFVKNFDTSSV